MATPVPERPDFIGRQYAFTAYLRDPAAATPPADVPPARLHVYRELLYKNIDGSLSACFPVLKSILGFQRWDALVQVFFARHRCATPIYRELPGEFLRYLDAHHVPVVHEPAFMRELAHYEWVELMLTLDPADADEIDADPEGNLLTSVPVLNPLARALTYAFPVHRLSPDYTPATPPSIETHLVIRRDRQDLIGFLEINPPTAALLALFGEESDWTGTQALEQVATACPQLDRQAVLSGGAQILHELRCKDVILGTRRKIGGGEQDDSMGSNL
jgi:hypothetical protein